MKQVQTSGARHREVFMVRIEKELVSAIEAFKA